MVHLARFTGLDHQTNRGPQTLTDEVMVHGSPIQVPYGRCQTFERRATITRASRLERVWTRATGDLEFMELCEFSFSEAVTL